jgi:MGT family glycosyltransferase
MWEEFNAWVIEQGAPPLPDLEFIHSSDVLNLYVYPEEIDYTARRPLGPTWHRLDSSVRETEQEVELPQAVREGDGALVYFSLGSLGSADVELMRRVIDCLAETPHRYVVSKGPLHTEVELAPNMWGAEFVPQTKVLPLVDLVITHGGNNTTTECFHFGKPMIVMPLFWDQYDNAQRVHETRYGIRMDTYRFSDDELRGAVDRLAGDTALRQRMALISRTIQGRRGLERAADLIEGTARQAALMQPSSVGS